MAGIFVELLAKWEREKNPLVDGFPDFQYRRDLEQAIQKSREVELPDLVEPHEGEPYCYGYEAGARDVLDNLVGDAPLPPTGTITQPTVDIERIKQEGYEEGARVERMRLDRAWSQIYDLFHALEKTITSVKLNG